MSEKKHGGQSPEQIPDPQQPQAEPAQEQQAAEPQPGPAEKPGPKTGREAAKKEKAGAAEALKAKLEAAEKAAGTLKDQLMRTAAEYDNFRKRSAREQDAAFNNGVGFAVNQILTILDTLEMAANAETSDENYKKGVVMTLEKAGAALAALKVEEIPALGQPFDPNVHSAVMQQPAAEGQESGTVVQVFQKGYKIGDRIIRHATVVVAE